MQLDWHGIQSPGVFDAEPAEDDIDLVAVRAHRLARARRQIAQHDLAACLVFDPVNIRYATGARNMQVFHQRNPARYLFLPVEGPVILFEFTGCMHLADGLETLDEVRPAITASYVAAGAAIAERERLWARETAALLREVVGAGARIGIERVNAGAALMGAQPSVWMVIVAFLFGIFAALARRRDDVMATLEAGGDAGRPGYNEPFLNVAVSVFLTVLVISYVMYVTDPSVAERTRIDRLHFTVPFVVAGALRYLQVILVDERPGEPFRLLWRDPFSLLMALGLIGTLLVLFHG